MNETEHMEKLNREGHHLYQMNDDLAYEFEPLTQENYFLTKQKDIEELPEYLNIKEELPHLIWDENNKAVECYNKAWEIAFRNLRKPTSLDNMVSSYIDTAFNGFLFMWDSSFITMFGKYAARVFDFQKTLDNFYSNQHMDGFICREIKEGEKGDQFHRFDPVSTGPNILPWTEWEFYKISGDKDRIKKVFPPLLAYHLWLKKNRTWPDGTYWSTGWAGGMDNQPRLPKGYSNEYSHGHMIWCDTCIQQILSDKILIQMAKLIGREHEVAVLKEEEQYLKQVINEKLWDDNTCFYYDLWPNGEKSMVKSIGAYWALLAEVVPLDKVDGFVAHLENENEFKRVHRVPTLSADHPEYNEKGDYWKGSVWAPTNYMVLKGLEKYSYFDLANEIAANHVENVCNVFAETGTLWENYAPETGKPGSPARPDFVGWTGLSPIAICIEQVFGIHKNSAENVITWKINCHNRHGILKYPIGSDYANLICPKHNGGEKPEISFEATVPTALEIIWPDGTHNKISATII